MTDSHQNSNKKRESKTKPILLHPEPQRGQEQVQESAPPDGLLLKRMQANPQSLNPNQVLQLQRMIGNQATARLLGRETKSVQRKPMRFDVVPIQAKLKVGPANDMYEQEADQIADTVMRTPTPVQRVYDKEEALHRKSISTIQRDGGGEGFAVDSDFQRELSSSGGGGRPLPTDIQAEFSSKMGADMRGVRVHTGEKAAALNQQIQAKAFTHGSDIYMGKGQYNPGSSEGKRLLAHEATHTIQQGTVQRAMIQRNLHDNDVMKVTQTIHGLWDILSSKTEWYAKNLDQNSGLSTTNAPLKDLKTSLGIATKEYVDSISALESKAKEIRNEGVQASGWWTKANLKRAKNAENVVLYRYDMISNMKQSKWKTALSTLMNFMPGMRRQFSLKRASWEYKKRLKEKDEYTILKNTYNVLQFNLEYAIGRKKAAKMVKDITPAKFASLFATKIASSLHGEAQPKAPWHQPMVRYTDKKMEKKTAKRIKESRENDFAEEMMRLRVQVNQQDREKAKKEQEEQDK